MFFRSKDVYNVTKYPYVVQGVNIS